MVLYKPALLCAVFLAALLLSVPAARAQDIAVAGSPALAPLYLKWFREYEVHTGIRVAYSPFGANIRPPAAPVDFVLMEAPMDNGAYHAAGPGTLNLPMVIHAVAVVYSLPGLGSATLRLTGPILADIYLGKITRWNDPQIARINPGIRLPDLAVSPLHQSSGSGATYVFTSYLSAVSPDWKTNVGSGKAVHWPVGLGGKGSVGAARVLANPGSLVYMDLSYAMTTTLSRAAVRNMRGQYIVPTVEAMTLAARAVRQPEDLRGSLVNSPAPLGYPLVGYTYLCVYKRPASRKANDLITWMLTEGQRDAAGFGYAPLPPSVRKQALAALSLP